MTTIELVRHAKAHSRDRWWGKPDLDRPLTESGMDQAREIGRALRAGGPIAKLYSSPYVRCTQTLDPLADALGVHTVEDEALGEARTLPVHDAGDAWVAPAWLGGRAVAFVNRVVAEYPGKRIVACSHGDVIPALMALLVGRDGLAIDDVRCRKGARFTLTFDGGRCLRAEHVPPPG
ncbi:hypothetical protein BH23ACT7_BH23ACT7_00180 [soil metagenome]